MKAYEVNLDPSKLEFDTVTRCAPAGKRQRTAVRQDTDLSDCKVRIRTQPLGNAFRAAAVVSPKYGGDFTSRILEVRRQVGDENYRVIPVDEISSQNAGPDRKKAIQQMMAEVQKDLRKWEGEIENHRKDTQFFELAGEAYNVWESMNA